MIDNARLLNHIRALNLPNSGIGYCERQITGGPSRTVGEYAVKSVSGHYMSRKAGAMIDFESRSSELGYLLESELDPSIWWIGAQPESVNVYRHDSRGRKITKQYTPDFLVITATSAYIVEVKTHEALEKLCEDYPSDWLRESDGTFRFLPAERAFADLGLDFRVWDSGTQTPVFRSNVRYLLQVSKRLSPDSDKANRVSGYFQKQAWGKLNDVRKQCTLQSLDDVLYFVSTGALHANLYHQLVYDTEAIVSTSPAIILQLFDNFKRPSPGSISLTEVPSMRQAKHALERLSRWQCGKRDRHWRRLERLVQLGKCNNLSPMQSLIPRTHNRGNFGSKLSTEQIELLELGIRNYWQSGAYGKLTHAYHRYRADLLASNCLHLSVSQTTFRTWASKQHQADRIAKRRGKRGANRIGSHVPPELKELKATRAFEYGAIDSTKLDLLLVLASHSELTVVARPWLTCLIDQATEALLGSWISFDAPSKASAFMAIRSCIATFGRLPEFIHSDRGAEFRSNDFKRLLAWAGVSLQFSPAANPRFNSDIERFFGHQDVAMLSDFPGTIIDYNQRGTSPGYHPKDTAALTLCGFAKSFREFQKSFNLQIAKGRTEPRGATLSRFLDCWPSSGCRIKADSASHAATCVPKARNDWKLSKSGSLHIDGIHYYCASLSTA